MGHKYRYCGLILDSEQSLPELEEAKGNEQTDIDVRLRRLGSPPANARMRGPNWTISEVEGWWWLKGQVTFRIQPGSIDIDCQNCEDSLARALLLEAPMIMAMIFSGIFCLNAAAVSHAGQTLVFCGASGSGRSTAVARLVLADGLLLTDSVARLEISGENVTIVPQGSGSLLWPLSISQLGMHQASGEVVRGNSSLRRIKLDSTQERQEVNRLYWRGQIPGRYVISDQAATENRERFARLAMITSGRLWIDAAGRSPDHFQWCHKIAQRCALTPAPESYFKWHAKEAK